MNMRVHRMLRDTWRQPCPTVPSRRAGFRPKIEPLEDRGRAVGQFVAAQILQARAHDNADSIQDPPYVPNGLPGFHNVDPTHPGQGFYAPDYESVTPFALRSADQFEPPALDDGTPAGRAAFLKRSAVTAA